MYTLQKPIQERKCLMFKQMLCYLGPVLLCITPAPAQFNSGSDGSDGAFSPTFETVIDLSLAATGAWDTPSPVPGQGVYDPNHWAVVFKYTSVDIPTDVVVTFNNHPSGAPVVWLATGDVNIYGIVNLDGESYLQASSSFEYTEPGPGGFAGGSRYIASGLWASAGFGPGGGDPNAGGHYGSGSRAYGSANIMPLIGGSGGGGSTSTLYKYTGGGGGGAILIASSGTINLLGIPFPPSPGTIEARGGNGDHSGGGSGGAIRLIANQISGAGSLVATKGSYGSPAPTDGRIRLEANSNTFTGSSTPAYTFSGPGSIFPASSAPTLRVTTIDTTIGDVPVPIDPIAGVRDVDVLVPDDLVLVNNEATNIPTGTTVTILMKPGHGASSTVTSGPLQGTLGLSTADAILWLPDGPVEIQLRANWTP